MCTRINTVHEGANMTEAEREMSVINIRVPANKKDELKELAHYCYTFGFIEKPELGKLFDLGMNLVFELCHKKYLEVRERKEE